MDRVNVMHMLGLTQAYGVERQLLDHLKFASLSPNGIRHYVCALKISDDMRLELEALHVPFIVNNLRTPWKVWSFSHYVRKNKIDILHAHNLLRYPIRTRIIPKLTGIPNVLEHERGMVWNRCPALLVRLTNGLSDNHICNSQAAKIMLKHKCNIEATVVHNGIKIPELKKPGDVQKILEDLALSPVDKVVGFVGRLNTPKGVPAYIKMVPIVRRQYPDAKFLIVGDGPMRQELEQYADSLGVRKDITFLGFRKDARTIMKLMDVVVVPSIRDPFGNVVIEAAFAQKPVVASCVDGLAETIVDGKTGFLVDCTEVALQRSRKGISRLPSCVVEGRDGKTRPPLLPNTEQLAERVIKCLGAPEEARQMGLNAYQRAKEYFSLERYRNDLDHIYRQMVNR